MSQISTLKYSIVTPLTPCFIPLFIGNNLITAANFCLNGKFAAVGTYDGRCIFYETEVREVRQYLLFTALTGL